MKSEDTILYSNAANYNNGPEFMRNEVDMWHAGGSLLLQEIIRRQKRSGFGGLQSEIGFEYREKIKHISILDVCSGPGNFPNYLSLYIPNIQVTGIDLNEKFLDYARQAYGHLGWRFIKADATILNLKKKFDFVTASSAYHHIPDEKKVQFLEKIASHLTKDGKIILCENFLPNHDTDARTDAIHKYYSALKNYYSQGNATPKALELIEEVHQLELSGEEEHKVDFRKFQEHVRKVSLQIEVDRIIWQPEEFKEDNAGSHVLLLRKFASDS